SLTDSRPTRLTIEWDKFLGVMSFEHELAGNPVNQREERVIESVPTTEPAERRTTKKYIVKTGDVCFVIIGQIVGREYQAVRYQPSGCVVVNTPTEDANLARQVRQIWASRDARRHLLDSLLLDFSTERVIRDDDPSEFGQASTLQCDAALRLLYY